MWRRPRAPEGEEKSVAKDEEAVSISGRATNALRGVNGPRAAAAAAAAAGPSANEGPERRWDIGKDTCCVCVCVCVCVGGGAGKQSSR